MSGMAHFFVVVSGSKIHERVAHFFIDIYTALIDRLTFHGHVLNMNGDSYRLKATMQDRN